MTPEAKRGIRVAVALALAAVVQFAFANGMTVWGAHPDILLTVAILCASFCGGNDGAAVGFFAGLMHASLASPPFGGFGSIIVSRTIVCFAFGWLEERVFRDNVLIAIALVALGTIATEALFFIFDPQRNVRHWAIQLGLTDLYNTLLAAPLYFPIRKLAARRRTT